MRVKTKTRHCGTAVILNDREIATLTRAALIIDNLRKHLGDDGVNDYDDDMPHAEHGLRAIIERHKMWGSISLTH